MPRIWKEAIRPGSYWYRDPKTGEAKKLDVTPEYVEYLLDSGNKMIDAGLSVPIPAEHDRDAVPQTPAQRAASQLLNNQGYVQRYALRPGHRLWAEMDIGDPETYRKLPKTIKFTSPWLNSFTDGEGRRWDGVITHLALTSRPVITAQEPFKDASAALAVVAKAVPLVLGGAPLHLPVGGLPLSLAGLLTPSPIGLWPVNPKGFDAYSGIALDLNEPLAKKKPKAKLPPHVAEDVGEEEEEAPSEEEVSPGEGERATSAPSPASSKEKKEHNYLPAEEMGLIDVLRDCMSALWGIDLPEETNEDTLATHLVKAMMAYLKSKNVNEGADVPKTSQTDQNANNNAAPVVQESPPMYMSLEEVNAITDPTTKRLASAMLSLQAQNQKLAKGHLDGARIKRDRRIECLCKKLPEAARDKLVKQAAGVSLSLQDDGTVLDPFAPILEILEDGVREIPSLLTQQGIALSVEDHPEEPGIVNEKRRQELVELLASAVGVGSKKTA